MHIYHNPQPPQALVLLEDNNLPTEDLVDNSFEYFFAFGDKDNALGVIGLELFDNIGLLRSLVVSQESRGKD